jgi:serine/threonine protein kinase/tetratricopeptide (TPR) repeat protein
MTCPDPAKLQQLLNEELSATEFAQIETHVEQCPHCKARLESWLLQGAGRQEAAPGPRTRYRIVHLHAQGGLGEVYLAEDLELNRQVALKRIQARYCDNPIIRRRFLQETEITARLEHPGVVPVYGLIEDEEGNPCYAMRFIHGESLEEAIRIFHQADTASRDPGERSLALRQLLTRFVAVCNAVAYAHSQGIVHRDLKPGNVMLGTYGETLVVDWGLAKPFARAETARTGDEPTLTPAGTSDLAGTRVGEVVGTPSYMSPEQAAGQPEQVGLASDVYSLGAILYVVLTGRPPFTAAPVLEKLEKVQRGDFPRPGTVKPCPPALEAVCLKAMAWRPEERYATALVLAAEVEHWLADEPVTAWPEPWTSLARRWVKRHPSWVTGGVAAVLLAAVGLAAVGLVQAAQEREKQERVRSRENYVLALDSSDELVQLAQALKTLPGTRIGSLEHLLTLADKNYGQMLSRARGEPTLLTRTAELLNTLSELHLDLGDTSKAMGRARQAHDVFQGLLTQDPTHPDWQRGLALSLEHLGVALWWQGDSEKGLDSCRQALATLQRLSPPASDTLEVQVDLARLHNRIGVLLADERDVPGAKLAYQESFRVAQALFDKNPRNPEVRHRRCIALKKVAGTRNPADALGDYQDAVKLYRELLKENPNNTEWDFQLMDSLDYLGGVHSDLDKDTQARACYDEALKISRHLLELDPANVSRKKDVLLAELSLLGLKKSPAPDAARERLVIRWQHHAAAEDNVKTDPNNGMWRSMLADQKAHIARDLTILGQPGDLERATTLLHDGFVLNEELRKQYPTRRLFAAGYYNLCRAQHVVLTAQQKPADGLASWLKGCEAQVEFFKLQAEKHPDNPAWKQQGAVWNRELVIVLERLVQLHEKLGEKDKTEEWRRKLQEHRNLQH